MEWLNVPGASSLSFLSSLASELVNSRRRNTVRQLNRDSNTGKIAKNSTADMIPPKRP